MKSYKNKKSLYFVVILMLFWFCFSGFGNVMNVNAISLICEKSAACREAAAREQEASKNAADAAVSANMYQAKVNDLTVEIAKQELEIAETEVKIKLLKIEIKETEETLEKEQEALAELLVNMHFESDAEPIKILAGASSISDLAERAAREEVVKEQISVSAAKVKDTKLRLETEREEVENLLQSQQLAKETMVTKKAEQESLVRKFESDAEAYTEEAKAAQLAQREAEREYQKQHANIYTGNSYTGLNTYPWQGDCPARQDEYVTYYENNGTWYRIGGLVCECVSYAGWKAFETYGVAVAWGHAYSWAGGAAASGYRVDNDPQPGTIGQIGGAPFGHVFWVESVNADGSINVTEYNNAQATYLYLGNFHYGDFGSRSIPANEIWQYNFIHFD